VYLDHNATTRVDPDVVAAMLPCLEEGFGNPSSQHSWGQAARHALESARRDLARVLGAADKDTIVFTGSGTEADNLALKGVAAAHGAAGHLIVSAVEHHAVLHAAESLAGCGWALTRLPVDAEGRLDPDDVRRAIRPDTVLVSVMHANNETGVCMPVAEVARICRERSVLLHTDAVQSFGKIPVAVDDLGVDLLSVSAHKIHGPKGVGALYVRRGTAMRALLHGGGQERWRRGGTENVAGAVGLARAAVLMEAGRAENARREAALRDRLEDGLLAVVPGVMRNGHPRLRLPQTSNLAFAGAEADVLIPALDLAGIAVSAGAACSSGAVDLSHVLTAMGHPAARARSSIRFSLGVGTTAEEIDHVLAVLPGIVGRVRGAGVAASVGVGR
jgi:cysteine desulfurase